MTWRTLASWISAAMFLVVVEGVSYVVERLPQMRPAMLFASDTSMRLHAWSQGHGDESGLQLGFIAMDEAFLRDHHGDGRTTNGDALLGIIQAAANQIPRPKAIIVDIDFSLPNQTNDALRRYLDQYSGPVPLVVVRTMRQHEEDGKPWFVQAHDGRKISVIEAIPEDSDPAATHPGIYSLHPDDVTSGSSNVYFASAGFLSAADGNVRSAIVAEPVCFNKTIHGIPSVELLAEAVGADRTREVADEVWRAFYGPCHDGKIVSAHIISLDSESARQRPIDLESRNIGLIAYTHALTKNDVPDDRLHATTASDFLGRCQGSSDAQTPPPECAMNRRIVVIGGSAEGDTYATPLGKMSGGPLLVNAIESLHQNGQVEELSYWPGLGIGLAVGFITSAVCSGLLRFGVRLSLSLLIVVAATFGLGEWLLRNGQWYDLGSPIIGFLVHPTIEFLSDLYRDVRRDGWRAEKPAQSPQRHAEVDDDGEEIVR